jgi:hypothetical protein
MRYCYVVDGVFDDVPTIEMDGSGIVWVCVLISGPNLDLLPYAQVWFHGSPTANFVPVGHYNDM